MRMEQTGEIVMSEDELSDFDTDSPYDRGLDDDMSYFDPDLIAGFFHRIELILDKCPIDIFLASSNAHPWPFRLQHYSEANPAAFHSSPTRILDSEITNPSINNKDLLCKAVSLDATYVVAKDYLPLGDYDRGSLDKEGKDALDDLRREYADNVEATTESIREFAELYEPELHPTPYVPLHPPYDDHYHEVSPIVENSLVPERYMLGGLKDAGPTRQIKGIHKFRKAAGSDPVAHGLGWGLQPKIVAEIRENPNLLDSVDNSTPNRGYRNGKMVDKNWQTKSWDHSKGTWATVVGGMAEMFQLLSVAHRMTEFAGDVDEFQTGIGEFVGVSSDD